MNIKANICSHAKCPKTVSVEYSDKFHLDAIKHPKGFKPHKGFKHPKGFKPHRGFKLPKGCSKPLCGWVGKWVSDNIFCKPPTCTRGHRAEGPGSPFVLKYAVLLHRTVNLQSACLHFLLCAAMV